MMDNSFRFEATNCCNLFASLIEMERATIEMIFRLSMCPLESNWTLESGRRSTYRVLQCTTMCTGNTH